MDMNQLVSIFCEIDDFCNELEKYCQHYMLTGPMKNKRGPDCGLAISAIMTILVMFQMSRFRDFKNFYKGFLCIYNKHYFPNLPGYERFVNLIKRAIFPLTILLVSDESGACFQFRLLISVSFISISSI